MARETKFGIALILILLSVFVGLLAKRLTKPTRVQVGDLAANSAPQAADSSKRAVAPAAPTLVTPKGENTRPPDGRYQLPLASTRNIDSTADKKSFSPTSQPAEQPPQLLARPTGVPEIADRYSTSRPAELTPPTAQSYRSAYGGTGDDAATHSKPEAPDRPADPFRARSVDMTDRYSQSDAPKAPAPSTSRVVVGGQTADNQAKSLPTDANPYRQVSPYPAQTPARITESSPASAPRYPVAAQPIASPYDVSPYNAQPAGPARGSGVTQAEATTIERDGDKYTVQPGDTYWTVCEKAYGSGAYFKALYEINRKRHAEPGEADQLAVGQVICVPDENVLRRKFPDLCPKQHQHVASAHQRLATVSTRLRGAGRVYTVVEGDTLFDIARYELGKSSRWGEIYDLNRDVLADDFDYLRPGLELILPDDGHKRENVTRQPEAIYPR